MARGGELQREGKRAVKGWGATRGCHGEQEVAGAGPEGGRRCTDGQRKQEGREEEEEAGLLCKFRKDQGSHCKTKISPKLGLK